MDRILSFLDSCDNLEKLENIIPVSIESLTKLFNAKYEYILSLNFVWNWL